MGNIHTVGPNEALIVSGGCCGSMSKQMVVGSWAWAWWLVTDVQRLSLEVMTLTPRCEHVETAQGVPLTVTGVAQCKVMMECEFLATAAELFLGKDVDHVKCVILQTLEGHLRAILGTLSVEEVYRDRDQFASLVREVASPDVGRMGIAILSFTINRVDYLASLGKSRTAAVKLDANVGVDQAERDAGIRKAEAQLAYELQAAKMKQKIRNEEIEIDVVERRKQIAIEETEILREEKDLTATVRLPAEAEAYKTMSERHPWRRIVGSISTQDVSGNKILSIQMRKRKRPSKCNASGDIVVAPLVRSKSKVAGTSVEPVIHPVSLDIAHAVDELQYPSSTFSGEEEIL